MLSSVSSSERSARVAHLNDQVAEHIALIDAAVAAGDTEAAERLGEAVERYCDELDALAA